MQTDCDLARSWAKSGLPSPCYSLSQPSQHSHLSKRVIADLQLSGEFEFRYVWLLSLAIPLAFHRCKKQTFPSQWLPSTPSFLILTECDFRKHIEGLYPLSRLDQLRQAVALRLHMQVLPDSCAWGSLYVFSLLYRKVPEIAQCQTCSSTYQSKSKPHQPCFWHLASRLLRSQMLVWHLCLDFWLFRPEVAVLVCVAKYLLLW